MIAVISLAVIALFANAANAISCVGGLDSVTYTLNGCTMCTKTVLNYRGTNGVSYTTTAYYGTGVTCLPASTATSATPATTAGPTTTAAIPTPGSCSPLTVGVITGAAASGLFSTLTNTCVTYTSTAMCSANDNGNYASCTCCTDNCNGASMRCTWINGASSLASLSATSLLLVAVAALVMRQ